jgi:hypothetical protein
MQRVVPVALVIAAGLAVPALAQGPIEVIFCKKPGDPKAAVPGWLDHTGAPIATEWKAMEDLAVSPGGSRWAVKARSTAGDLLDTGIVVGSGTFGAVLVAGGHTFVEGQPAATVAGSSGFFEFVGSGFVKWDDSNNTVFGMRARTTQTGTTSATDGQRVYRIINGNFSLAFKQLDPYTGMTGTAPTVGNSVTSWHLLNDGRIGSYDPTVNTTTLRPALSYFDPATNAIGMFHQPTITTITDLDGVSTIVWYPTDSDFYTTPNGQHWYAEGRRTTSTGTRFIAVDGRIRIQDGVQIGSSGVVAGDFFQTVLFNNGDWYCRGRDNSATTTAAPDYFAKNGTQILAKTGEPITPGSTELWGDTFYAMAANEAGDWILAGNTNNPEPGRDVVVVLNGTQVIMREGDPIDLNGDGQFNDGAWLGRGVNTNAAVNANTWFLTSARVVFGIIMLRDGELSGSDINVVPAFGSPQAFIRQNLGGPAPCYANCDGSTVPPVLNVGDFTCFLQRFAAGESYANCDGSTVPPVLNVGDFTCFLQRFAAGCR